MLDLEWIFCHASQVKEIIKTVFSEETQEDIEDFKEKMDELLGITFDILKEPAEKMGIKVERSRAFINPKIALKILKRLSQLADIIEYKAEE